MVEIILKDGQTGYDVVEEYVQRYWKHKEMTDTVIVSIGISRSGEVYEHINEVVSPCDCDVEFLYDWWEGERFIRLFGIKSLGSFNITGGVYTEMSECAPDIPDIEECEEKSKQLCNLGVEITPTELNIVRKVLTRTARVLRENLSEGQHYKIQRDFAMNVLAGKRNRDIFI